MPLRGLWTCERVCQLDVDGDRLGGEEVAEEIDEASWGEQEKQEKEDEEEEEEEEMQKKEQDANNAAVWGFMVATRN